MNLFTTDFGDDRTLTFCSEIVTIIKTGEICLLRKEQELFFRRFDTFLPSVRERMAKL